MLIRCGLKLPPRFDQPTDLKIPHRISCASLHLGTNNCAIFANARRNSSRTFNREQPLWKTLGMNDNTWFSHLLSRKRRQRLLILFLLIIIRRFDNVRNSFFRHLRLNDSGLFLCLCRLRRWRGWWRRFLRLLFLLGRPIVTSELHPLHRLVWRRLLDVLKDMRDQHHQKEPCDDVEEECDEEGKSPMCLIAHQTPPVSVAMDT